MLSKPDPTALPPLTLEAIQEALPDIREGLRAAWQREGPARADVKSVAVFAEETLHQWCAARFAYTRGSTASGLDFPAVPMDFKVTDAAHPQSSIPALGRHEMLWGLGYHVLIATYRKVETAGAIRLALEDCWLVEARQTADRRTTEEVARLLRHGVTDAQLAAYLQDRLPFCSPEEAQRQVVRIRQQPPRLGVLTLRPAMQYRATYRSSQRAALVASPRAQADLFTRAA